MSADQILEEAAEWLIRASDGALDEAAERELAMWRHQSPAHERAWQAACKLRSMFGSVPSELGSVTLRRQRMDRRAVMKSLAALAIVPTIGWLGYTELPWAMWQADIRTAKGEQRTVSLPDGGELVVNTDTAVDIDYSGTARTLKLHHGEIQVTTAPDPAATPRPLVVKTDQGRVRALGTTFMVRTDVPGDPGAKPQTNVTVIRHAVAILPRNALKETIVEANLSARFSGQRVYSPEPAADSEYAWVRGQLIADNRRLDEFLAELARYRPGVLRADPALSTMRISGVFQLKNTNQVLSVLASTLPIRVSRLTDYWVTVAPAPH